MKKIYTAFAPIKLASWYKINVLCLYDSSKKIKVREIQDQAIDLALDFFSKKDNFHYNERLSLYVDCIEGKEDFIQERRALFAQELLESILIESFLWLKLSKSALMQRISTIDMEIFLATFS